MFGVMAIANIIIVGLAMFSDLGLKQNIIQSKRGEDPIFLNTVWSVQIIRGFILGFVCLVFVYVLNVFNESGLISKDSVYASELLPQVLILLALSPIIQGLESTKLACANRALYLKRIVTLELVAQLFGLAFMLTWVYFDQTIWALVVGAIFSGIVKTSLSHLILPGHPNKLSWEKQSFDEIFRFGKWMFLSSILGFLINQGDKLLLGGVLSSNSFGLYSIAALLYASLEGLILKLISNVAFPALGEINRADPKSVRDKYYKIRFPIDIFCLLIAGFLFCSGTTTVDLLYDDRYLDSGLMLQVLSLILIVIRFGVAGQLYLVMGKPKIMAMLMLSRLLFMLILIPLGHQLNGDIGAVWGLVVAYFPGLILTFFYKIQYGLIDVKKELGVLPIFLIGLVLGTIFNWAINLLSLNATL
jgi:O-antigen/teichoic acid export membrane protein